MQKAGEAKAAVAEKAKEAEAFVQKEVQAAKEELKSIEDGASKLLKKLEDEGAAAVQGAKKGVGNNPAVAANALTAPGGAKTAPEGRKFSLDVPALPSAKKDLSLGKFEFEIEIKPKISIAGYAALDDKDATKIDTKAIEEAAIKAATGWFNKEAKPSLESKGLLANAKAPHVEGTKLVATTFTETRFGKITLTFTIVGLDLEPKKDASVKASLKVTEAKGELEQKAIELEGTQEIDGL